MAVKLKTGRSATLYHSPQVHYLYRRFNYNDSDPTVTQHGKVPVGVLPDKCLPLETYVRINSSCSAADIIVGTTASASSAAVVSTADVDATSSGVTVVDRYYGTSVSSDTALYIQFKTTGATMGQVDVWQAFLPALPSTF